MIQIITNDTIGMQLKFFVHWFIRKDLAVNNRGK